MRLITRSQWGARYGDGVDERPLPTDEAYLHHSVTLAPNITWVDADSDNVDDDEERAMRAIEDIGVSRFGTAYGFPYTAAFMPRGNAAYLGHAVGQQGAHTYGHNDTAVGFVLVGNYETRAPTDAQMDAVAWTLVEFKRRGWLKTARLTGGHRDVKATACPGQAAYDAIPEINRRAAALEKGEDEMSEAQFEALQEAIDGTKQELAGRLARAEQRLHDRIAATENREDLEQAEVEAKIDAILVEVKADQP